MKRHFFLSIFLVLSIIIPKNLSALNPDIKITQYVQKTWQIEDGLPQISVQTITQTANGYLWFGTEEGLVRFDGIKFKVYNKKTTPAFKHNNVNYLITTKDDKLIIGTYGGGIIIYKDGIFTNYSEEDGLCNNLVVCLFEDRKTNLWIGTHNGGISRFKDGKFESFTTKNGLIHDVVTTITEDNEGYIWFGTMGGISRYKDDRFINYTMKDGLLSNFVRYLFFDRNGNMLIGTVNGGLMRFRENKFIYYTESKSCPFNNIRTIFEDNDGNLWIGSSYSGLARYNGKYFEVYKEEDGLANNSVLCVYEDLEKNLWFGTRGGGLSILHDSVFTNITPAEGLSDNIVLSTYVDSKQNIWCGTYKGGLNKISNQEITHFKAKDGLNHNLVLSLCEDHKNRMWIGSYRGLNCIDNGRFIYFDGYNVIRSHPVISLYYSSKNELWAGTLDAGLFRFTDNGIVRYSTDNGLPNNYIRCITESSSGLLWFGSTSGVIKFDGKIFTLYTKDDGLGKDMIDAILEDSIGNLWIGTAGGGLSRFVDNRFITYSMKDGLYKDSIFSITEDNNYNLWMSCNKGVFKVNIFDILDYEAQKKVSDDVFIYSENFGITDGMKTLECNGGSFPSASALKNDSGKVKKIFFPTIKGITYVNPDNITLKRKPPLTLIEEVILNDSILNSKNFEYGKNKLTFKYTACSFQYPETVSFKTKLDGYDVDWNDVGARREAFYNNLPPGNYTFRVIGRNSDGIESVEAAIYNFTITPQFVQTPLFYILIGSVLLVSGFGLTYLFMRRRQKRLKRRQRELELKVEERTRDLNRSNDILAKTNGQLQKTNDKLEKTIIELKQAQEQAAKAQKELMNSIHLAAVGETAGQTAHEVLNPLTIISGKIQTLHNDLDDTLKPLIELIIAISNGWDEDYRKGGIDQLVKTLTTNVEGRDDYLVIDEDIDNLKEITSTLKEFNSKAESSFTYLIEKIDRIFKIINKMKEMAEYRPAKKFYIIKDLIEELKYVYKESLKEANITFNVVELKSDIGIKLDRNNIYQALSHVIRNSIEAISTNSSIEEGKIEITINKFEEDIAIKITDNGVGIKEESRPYIFEPGFTSKVGKQSVGYGLSISRRLIRGHGGEISLISTEENGGSTFLIILPI